MTRFIIIILLFCSTKVISQTKHLDSIHLSRINYFKNINSDSLFYYCNKLGESNNICKKLEASTGRAYGFYKLKNYDESERIANQVIKQVDSILEKENLTCLLDRKTAALNRLFWIKKNQEKYEEAYSVLIKCENVIINHPIKDQINFRNILGITLSKAIIKNKLNMQQSAKDILLDAISEIKNPILKDHQKEDFFIQWQANTLNCLGNIYLSINNKSPNKVYLDSADYYFDKAYKTTGLFTPLHNDSEIIYNFKKAEVLMAKKEFSKAIDLIDNYKNISNGYNYFNTEYFQKAICFHNLNNSDSAIYYSNHFLKDSKKLEPSKLITIYDILSNEYNKLNKLDSAYKYSKLTLNQYNLARKNKDKTFNLFYNNNFNKTQQLNNTIKKRESDKQRKLIISFVVLLLTLAIITFYLLKGERKKKEELLLQIHQNKPIEIEKKEYNIDKDLENKILNEFKNVTKNLDFLKPDFSINYIANKLETNTTYISFVFNKYHRESFKQYCTKLKINYVVEKLKTDKNFRKYSIQAVAEEIGYTNASAFTRAFKKHVGVTPSIFLKNLDIN
ncbi:helix-turn-helix domain-containing protein [Tenacibaculum caenipelagi]|uniref:Helix-turn-helix protein n=1 Tax=Tenacibaculum caenipelagi TaxID=1325435 RepID=A0A4V3D337_9FLAO|nr:helix-turn-helix domain-containing protein [Tenacibaculum caenipelagi]TDQ27764.1 helix-turn-helix protein [Tenacibaculum caenipelagi]